MGQFKGTFDGAIVAEPTLKEFSSGASVLEFPVYINDEDKDKNTGKYEKNGDVTKIQVKVWSGSPIFAEVRAAIQRGDIVEVTGTVKEREYDKNDGSKGRALETKWVDSVVVKYRPEPRDGSSAPGGFGSSGGFGDSGPVPSGF